MPGKPYYFRLITAGLFNLLLFAVFICLAHPIYDTNEDLYILYQLSGGFGSTPTELLHYNHTIPPFLGIFIKNLFHVYDKVNWYTVILLLAHYLACTSITVQILKKATTTIGLLAWLTIFIVFESQLLLTINFTNTAIVLGLSGTILLATYRAGNSIFQLIYAGLFLVAGSLFRIHMLIPIVGIALPFFIFPYRPQRLMAIASTLAITVVSILLLNYTHQAYYKSNISGWAKEEEHRQKIFSLYNNRTLHQPLPQEKWYTEFSLIHSGLPIDTSFLSDKALSQMLVDLKAKRTARKPVIADGKNWFFINNRILFCLVLVLFLLSMPDRKHTFLLAASVVLIVGGLIFLNTNYKLADYLVISSLYLLSLLILLSHQKRPRYFYIYTSLLAVIMFWGTVRIYKNNQRNIAQIASFKEAYQEISATPQNLFIIADDSFPLQKFYVFDLPKQFRLPNFINSELFMNNTYLPVLNRFGSDGLQSIPYNNHIFFRGKQLDALENYFNLTSGKQVITVFDNSQSQSQKVYRIIFRP